MHYVWINVVTFDTIGQLKWLAIPFGAVSGADMTYFNNN